MNWGKAIFIIREKRGYTQNRLAHMLGISRPALSAIERGKSRPSEETLKKIAEVLNMEVALITLLAVNPETDMSEEVRSKFNDLFPDFRKQLLSFIGEQEK